MIDWIPAYAGMSGAVRDPSTFNPRIASHLRKVHHFRLPGLEERSMHDIVIRGGTIVDGTGKAAFTGDVAIAGERIAEVGGKQGPARREIDATGLLVTPGWVDVHTHYDGQAMWDPLLGPSCWHGVTTTMFGNCGVGFAPVRPQHRGALMELMEGVEEIPGVVLDDGLTWEWESFPDFLDALERRPRAIDIAAQIAHHPLRVYVMGDRAIRLDAASAEDIAEMRRLTIEALRAGAFGFTTSRTDSHKTPVGEWCRRDMPGAKSCWASAPRWAPSARVPSA
jgi:N-acyl-D-aspartate/D-glutamate deacylase